MKRTLSWLAAADRGTARLSHLCASATRKTHHKEKEKDQQSGVARRELRLGAICTMLLEFTQQRALGEICYPCVERNARETKHHLPAPSSSSSQGPANLIRMRVVRRHTSIAIAVNKITFSIFSIDGVSVCQERECGESRSNARCAMWVQTPSTR